MESRLEYSDMRKRRREVRPCDPGKICSEKPRERTQRLKKVAGSTCCTGGAA